MSPYSNKLYNSKHSRKSGHIHTQMKLLHHSAKCNALRQDEIVFLLLMQIHSYDTRSFQIIHACLHEILVVNQDPSQIHCKVLPSLVSLSFTFMKIAL